jgi:hypothetical protein
MISIVGVSGFLYFSAEIRQLATLSHRHGRVAPSGYLRVRISGIRSSIDGPAL